MEQIQLIKDIDTALGYRSFCEAYLKARTHAEKECDNLSAAAQRAAGSVEHINKAIQSYDSTIQNAENACKAKQKELDALRANKKIAMNSSADLTSLQNEQDAARSNLISSYRSQENNIRQEQANLENIRAQNKLYLDTLARYRTLYEEMHVHKDAVKKYLDALKVSFPAQAADIDEIVNGTFSGLSENDFNFKSYLKGLDQPQGVFKPMKTGKIIDCIIDPSRYPYSFLTEKEFKTKRIFCLAILVLGILAGFVVHPIFNPLSIVLAYMQAGSLTKKHNAALRTQIDWDRLRVLRTILKFNEADIERLARKKANLPDTTASNHRKEAEQKLKQMNQQLVTMELTLASSEQELSTLGRTYSDLSAQWNELLSQGEKPNTRLSAALQKQRNGLELTPNQDMLIREYEQKLSACRAKLEPVENRINSLSQRIQSDQKRIPALKKEIAEYKRSSDSISARLEQIEQNSTSGGSTIESRVAALHDREQQELAALERSFEEKRRRLQSSHSSQVDRELQLLDNKIRQAEKDLRQLQQNKSEIENNHANIHQRRKAAQGDADKAAQRLAQARSRVAQLHSAEGWKAHTDHWMSLVKKDPALIYSDADSYTVLDECYVMGSTGPYLLAHNNKPCVLLYDELPEHKGLTPSELLRNTIGAIATGLQKSNKPGLTAFAVVNEYSDDSSLPRFIQCFGKNNLNELHAQVDKMRADLSNETTFGRTVKDFNLNYSKQMLQNSAITDEELLKLMKKTLYTFILPTPGSENRPMNHDRLWEKVRGNCHEYGFVPIFLIPREKWYAALGSAENNRSAFAEAVKELNNRGHVTQHTIVPNKVK